MVAGKLVRSGVAEDIESFRIGLHEAVLDSVMDHLDEMAGTGRAAVKIAEFCRASEFFPAGRARNVSCTGRESLENGVKTLYRLFRPADHHAVTALQAPDAAAGTDVD